MNKIKYHILLILIVLLPLSCSCYDDQEFISPEDTINNVNLLIEIPGQQTPSSYAMTTADENKVNELTLLAFKDYSGTERLESKVVFAAGAANIINDGLGNLQVKLALPAGSYNRLVLVVNANNNLSSMVTGSSTLTDLNTTEYSHATGAWDVTTPTYIPMWGESKAGSLNGFIIKAGISQTFSGLRLIRMLARVDIINNASASFALKTVSLYNMNRNGLITANANYLTASPKIPNLPGTLLAATTSAMTYNFAALAVSNKMENQIYTFEAAAAKSTEMNASPRIIALGTYAGIDYYYPIDFTYDGSSGTQGNYMPLVRNHKYIFTIVSVAGKGYNTPAEALAAKENHTNMVVQTLTVNDSFQNVFYNGNTYLGITQLAYSFDFNARTTASTDNKLSIQTNASNWSIKCTDADGVSIPLNNWLMTDINTGPGNTKATVSVNTSIAGGSIRTGYLIISAGRLEVKVKITADGCGSGGVAKLQKIGTTNSYLTHRYGTACWMVQNSKEGTAKAVNYNNETTKVNGSYYTWAQINSSNPCPAGWHVPQPEEFDALSNLVNANPAGIGQWWTTSAGNAFAGYNEPPLWLYWNTYGAWATSTTDQIYYADTSGIFALSAAFVTYNPAFSVRCVQN